MTISAYKMIIRLLNYTYEQYLSEGLLADNNLNSKLSIIDKYNFTIRKASPFRSKVLNMVNDVRTIFNPEDFRILFKDADSYEFLNNFLKCIIFTRATEPTIKLVCNFHFGSSGDKYFVDAMDFLVILEIIIAVFVSLDNKDTTYNLIINSFDPSCNYTSTVTNEIVKRSDLLIHEFLQWKFI